MTDKEFQKAAQVGVLLAIIAFAGAAAIIIVGTILQFKP
jgi:hypothetical protein